MTLTTDDITKLYHEIKHDLWNYALVCSGWNRSNAEDAIQEAFEYLSKKTPELRDKSDLRSYFFSMVKSKIFDGMRREGRNEKTLGRFKEMQDERNDVRRMIAIIVSHVSMDNMLTDRQKDAFFLKYFGKLSMKEIALTLGISERTLYREMSILHEKLVKDFDIKS